MRENNEKNSVEFGFANGKTIEKKDELQEAINKLPAQNATIELGFANGQVLREIPIENRVEENESEASEESEPVQKEEFYRLKQTMEEIRSYLTSVEDRPLGKRNFELEIKSGEKPDIILKKENGKLERMSNFLSRDATFKIGAEFEYDHAAKRVVFQGVKANSVPFFVQLCHDIAHSYEKESRGVASLDALMRSAENVPSAIREIGKQIEENPKKRSHLEKLFAQIRDAKTFDAFMDEYMKERASLEQHAWTSGLRIVWALEREGFHVLAGFNDWDDVQQYVAANLYSYEIERLMRKARIGTLTPEEKQKHVFVKHF